MVRALALVGLLCLLGLGWTMVRYWDTMGSLVQLTALLKTQALQPAENPVLITGAMRGMVDALGDPYSAYLDRDEYQELTMKIQASFGGVGLVVGADEKDQIRVVSPMKDTPAARAGIRAGDIILSIDRRSTVGMSLDQAARLLRGDPGTQVIVGVYRESDGQEHQFRIIREIIQVPSVEWRVLEGEPRLGYLYLMQFSAHSASEVEQALDEMTERGARGLVLDLRDDPGGDFEAAVKIADQFLDSGTIVRVVDRGGAEKVYEAKRGAFTLPVVVLINQGTASSAEILAGALQDSGRAVLVGEKSFGKGLVQTVFPLVGGDALKVTTDRYETPKGTDIDRVGIAPDYVVKPQDGADVQLERARQLLVRQLQRTPAAAA
jgi:carboxyl-terminal processing protease